MSEESLFSSRSHGGGTKLLIGLRPGIDPALARSYFATRLLLNATRPLSLFSEFFFIRHDVKCSIRDLIGREESADAFTP